MADCINRIEREYLLKNMTETRSPLLLVFPETMRNVKPDDYSITGDRLQICGFTGTLTQSVSVRVYFLHQKRGIYFDSLFSPLHEKSGEIDIPDALFLDEQAVANQRKVAIDLRFGEQTVALVSDELFLVSKTYTENIPPESAHEKISTIADVLKCRETEWIPAIRVYRLIEHMRADTAARKRFQEQNTLLFLDHCSMTVAVLRVICELIPADFEADAVVRIGERTVHGKVRMDAKLNITASLSVYKMKFETIHEEDKRFLFEQVYVTLYNC